MKRKQPDISNRRSNASGPHRAVHKLLLEAFPSMTVKEEQTIHDVTGNTLYVDLVVKELAVCV